jgi:DNA-binding GntR family transcriptional regulator
VLDMKPISLPGRDSRANEIYDVLREAILTNQLAPSERLLEEAIAKMVSASRTPVREALHRLEMDGLVRQTSRGAVVTDHSADELAELCVVRESLEGLAARLAAGSRSDTELSVVDATLDSYERAIEAGAVDDVVEANHAFHEAVWQASHNRYLMDQLELLRGVIERLDTTTLTTPERQHEALDEHRSIARAIEDRDAARAEELTRAHVAKGTALRIIHKRSLQRSQRRKRAEGFR